MIAIARVECEESRPVENIVAAVLVVGQRLTLTLPDGAILEITLDRIYDPHVALVLALTTPWTFQRE